jgi:nucleotide-binding universal stress UspA family protein
MLNIKKILLPVDFPNASLRVLHQAAMLARHFQSEIVLLYVVSVESQAAGVPQDGPDFAGWNLLAEILKVAEKNNNPDQSLRPQLQGLTTRSVLREGDTAQAIVQTAQVENADLIMMPSHGRTFNRFLLGSAAAKAGSECPVWTGTYVEEPPIPAFAIHSVLCAIDFGPRSQLTASWAAQMADAFGARLTLANVTYDVGIWAPGGNYVNPRLKAELVADATDQMAALQKETGIKADVFIGSGDVPKVLSQAAKQTQADLLVTGCYPYGGNLRINGYNIISASLIPVLNVAGS